MREDQSPRGGARGAASDGSKRHAGWSAGYCEKTAPGPSGDTVGDCTAGNKGFWELKNASSRKRWDAAATACRRLCKACSRCRFISISLKYMECDWFHKCDMAQLQLEPVGFQTAFHLHAASSRPLSEHALKDAYRAWYHVRMERNAELDTTVFKSINEVRSSRWHAYLDRVYGESTLTFPLPLRRLEFFYMRWLPRSWFDWRNSSHQAQVNLDEGPSLGDLFVLHDTHHAVLFRYAYPALSGYTQWHTGEGRRVVDFKYAKGFRNHTRVEVIHFGAGERALATGFWCYLAPGSGVWLDLGKTIVFPEHYDALQHFTGCVPAVNASKSCRWYQEPRHANRYAPGRRVRAVLSTIYARARASGYDTLQYTHRSEGVYQYEVVDLRLPGDLVADACGYRPATFSGWQGTQPCRCDGNLSIMNCGRGRASR